MTAPVLEMRGIRKAFPGVVALDGVDLTLEAGDVLLRPLREVGLGRRTHRRSLDEQAQDVIVVFECALGVS